MSAQIIILPIIKVERPERSNETIIAVHLHPRDLGRLRMLASQWHMTEAETAEFLLSQALEPKGRR